MIGHTTSRTRCVCVAVAGTLIPFAVLASASACILASGAFDRSPLEKPISAGATPNPQKAPLRFLGFQELLIGYDPFLACTVVPTLLLVGPATVAWWAWWVVAATSLAPQRGAPTQRLRWIFVISAVFGLALAWPWLYVVCREVL
jgi:hypothetical protein